MANLFGHSAFTLRRNSPSGWSFSKDQRFKSPRRQDNSDFITPPSSLNARATSIGFGQRWKPNNPGGKDSPSPAAYSLPSTFNPDLGPKLVKATILPPVGIRHISPGPGAYDAHSTIGKHSPKFSFQGRKPGSKVNENPPPNAYYPNRTLTEFGAYKSIGFGYGDRSSLNKSQEVTPGPGAYNLNTHFGEGN